MLTFRICRDGLVEKGDIRTVPLSPNYPRNIPFIIFKKTKIREKKVLLFRFLRSKITSKVVKSGT